ncbi:glycosyl hydrolase family 28-related protein [Streptomyces sp. NPDC051662]|uniref:right-handed parallel beta-helix repeat-containing protein n=1 Tax=Streptomyces sp. NPDC051662 TaxID=3154750 RepID=UPI00342F4DD6
MSELVADDAGMVRPFYGPEDAERLWVDFGGGRVALAAADVGDRLNAHLLSHDPHGDRAAVVDELNAQKGAATGLATLDEYGLIPLGQIPAVAQAPAMGDWINVLAPAYGATGDGSTDDTAALQKALSGCAAGGVVYLPRGVYRVSAPLDVPRGVTLMGSHSNLMVGPGMNEDDSPCYVQALPNFVGRALITIAGDDDGSHPAINAEQRLTNLMLDGSKFLAGTADGVYAWGNVQNVVLRDVCIRKMPGNGVATGPNEADEWPYSWRLHSVMVDNCHANGFAFERNTDLTMIDCQAIGVGSSGFQLTNCANSTLLACRAEWTGGYGFHLTGAWGNWPGSGSGMMSACSTDRCGWDGVRIDATGNGPFIISSLMTRRDGRNGGTGGGGYAGLALLQRSPVIVTGLTCYPGTDDQGTAGTSPQYGVRISGARDVHLDSAYLHAATAGIYDDGTSQRIRLGRGITTNAGNNYSEARIPIGD